MATINGTSGSDTLNGTSGNDTLSGLGGNDTLVGSGGTDFYDGGTGSDTLDLRSTSAGITVNFVDGTIGGGFAGRFVNIERVLGSDGGDNLIGAAGNQTLSSRGGNDTLAGGVGADTLWGGGGADRFVFRETGTANADSIADFASASDKIVLDASVMSALGASGSFAAGDARFVASSSGTAQDASDRIIYNTSTRQIFYDADGNGSGAAVLIATLQSGATLAATDIVVEGQNGGPAPIVGTDANDTLIGTDGNDTIDGRGGNDSLIGGDGADGLIGGEGNDTLIGGFAGETRDLFADTLDGGLGDDVYFVTAAEDIILPDPGGVDTVVMEGGSWTLGEGLENLSTDEGSGVGNNLDNVMTGGHSFWGMGGNDRLGTWSAGGSTSAHGGEGNDTLAGGGSHTFLFGDAGDDVLMPGTWTDWFEANELTGGAGADSFVFTQAVGSTENLILDFTSAEDKIVLEGNAHLNIGASGRFAAGDARFAANSTGAAQDASDRVIYNTATGELWYDADGSAAGAAALIATLQGAPALAASDIEVVNGDIPGQRIEGTAGNDNLTGTAGDDTIDGLAGNDTIAGAAGHDLLIGGAGDDHLYANAQTDRDTLDGGIGDDTYHLDSLEGTPQNVVLVDAGGVDTVIASGFTLADGFENLIVRSGGGAGNALDNIIRIESASGTGSAGGAEGNDTLIGGAGGNRMFGDDGNDLLAGRGNALDSLTGGAGADTFLFDTPATAEGNGRVADFESALDTIRLDATVMPALGASGRFTTGDGRFTANSTGSAQDSSDRVIYNTSTGELWYDADGSAAGAAGLIAKLEGAPALAATDIEVVNGTAPSGNMINGTSGNDVLTGTAGNDTLNGVGGNDTLVGSGGSDFYDGGTGTDTLDVRATASGVTVNFSTGTISGGFSGTFANIERVLASDGADHLVGATGNQTLSSRGGNDTLAGGVGIDTLWGGGGADVFIFREMGAANADRIEDFASGSDKVHLDDAAFTAIGAMGNFASADARFKANVTGTATDTDDRVVFNTSTGQLYYDADGSGTGAAPQLIATVQSGATVAATDIVVI